MIIACSLYSDPTPHRPQSAERWLIWLPTAESMAGTVWARRARTVERLPEHPPQETAHPTRLPRLSAATFWCLLTLCGRLLCPSLVSV
eukprot:1142479-Pleurochrysis_carterae.AAC.1